MKKFFICMAAAAALVVTGCKSLPEPETVENLAFHIGMAAGVVVNMEKVPASTTDQILVICDAVRQVVPSTNETFAVAWAPVVDQACAELVAKGKVSEDQVPLIKMGMATVAKAVDYMFKRHPKWAEHQEIVAAATHGVIDGFCTVVKPSNEGEKDAAEKQADQEALTFLLADRCMQVASTK